jgi:3-hydroxyisobutyrate dehydrogenase/2-hydroxy-3-oxopropionate reductase
MQVAFLGLGRMGAPMAARIAAAGHRLTVWNRTPRPELVPDGARWAATPAEAATAAEVVVTMLADGAALEAVLAGSGGLLGGAPRGAVLLEMSTIGPEAAAQVALACAARGIGFVDAPVSGSVALATAGTLSTMVGGADADVETVLPVLHAMTARQQHLGPVGSGATMKLAINLMLAAANEMLAETLVLIERAGIPREVAYDVLAGSVVGSPYVGYKRDAFLAPESAPVAFSVDLMRKDVALALALAQQLGAPTPAGTAAGEVLDATSAAGLGDADLVSVLRTLEQR